MYLTGDFLQSKLGRLSKKTDLYVRKLSEEKIYLLSFFLSLIFEIRSREELAAKTDLTEARVQVRCLI